MFLNDKRIGLYLAHCSAPTLSVNCLLADAKNDLTCQSRNNTFHATWRVLKHNWLLFSPTKWQGRKWFWIIASFSHLPSQVSQSWETAYWVSKQVLHKPQGSKDNFAEAWTEIRKKNPRRTRNNRKLEPDGSRIAARQYTRQKKCDQASVAAKCVARTPKSNTNES